VSLKHGALGLIARRPASGYELLKRFQRLTGSVWPATQSQLYGELGRLTETRLLAVSEVGARGRREYSITEAGRAELVRWMMAPQDDPAPRSARLLRVILLDQLSLGQAHDYIEALQRSAAHEHARYEQIRDSHTAQDTEDEFLACLVLEYGLRLAKMQMDWATWVGEQLDEHPDESSTVGGMPMGSVIGEPGRGAP
jgi:PadR family transcriptional regulator, regulatory protein AphA